MFCRSCGENIPVDSVFCPNCGKNLLEVSERQVPMAEPEVAPIAIDEEPRRFRRRRPTPTEVGADDGGEDEPFIDADSEGREPRDYSQLWARLSLKRLLWIMGLAFAAVGFIVGLVGDIRPALAWILFGLVLTVSASQAPETTREDLEEPPSGIASDDASDRSTEEMRD